MRRLIFFIVIVISFASVAHASDPPLIEQGFRDMYDLNFSMAQQHFSQFEAQQPANPLGPVSEAAGYLFGEFARLGVLETQLFVDDNSFEDRKKLVPDPAVKQKIDTALNKADQLANAALGKDPADATAQFAKVLSLGLRSDYAALIEKRDLAALSYTKQGRTLAEQVLKERPTAYDAYLAVGVENYLSGIKPAPVRWFLQMGGVQTDKAQGIHDLTLTAEHGNLLAPFARVMLAVADLRDKNTGGACTLLHGLATEFPHNQLYHRELGLHCH